MMLKQHSGIPLDPTTETTRRVDRRSFLRAVGLGAVTTVAPLATGDVHALNPGAEEKRSRYRETEHVKAFYNTNRY